MNETLVALLRRRGRFWTAEPLFPAARTQDDAPGRRSTRHVTLASNRVDGSRGRHASTAREGEIVLVGLDARPQRSRAGAGARILRRLGSVGVARDVIEALMLSRGLSRDFEPDVRREARELPSDPHQQLRRDLTALPTFTIDPRSARDFDDAISAERDRQALRIWVHIADVSAYVREGSPLDREARRRATSVYVPGIVEPMLPHELSSGACSLMPGQERLAVTVELELVDGKLRSSSFYRSLIRSNMRLDYEGVDRIFAGEKRAEAPWGSALELAREAALALGLVQSQRSGALALDAPEPQIELDADGGVTEIAMRQQTESHKLIERLMIAANEAVAELLQRRGVPCLYRVHERPKPERMQLLVAQLASLGVQTPPAHAQMSPSQASELIGELSRNVEAHVRQTQAKAHAGGNAHSSGGRLALTSLLLRSLQQAYYSPRNIGHAGLGSSCYCHFTSPIRRYPDIVCHRALLSCLGQGEQAPRAQALPQLGEWCSERERGAMVIERDADDVARCFALEATLYEEGFDAVFQGEVSGLIGAGAFIAFDLLDGEHLALPRYEGMLPVRRMRSPDGERDWWAINEQGTILKAERSGASLRLGDEVLLRVSGLDTLRGRVDLEPAG